MSIPTYSLLGLFVLACSSPSSRTVEPPSTQQNEVIVMGAIHGKHTGSALYGTERVKEIIRAVNPDYILAEIPPDRLSAARTEFEKTGTITEQRVSRFPEYVDAVFPLLSELSFEVIGCAAWTEEMASERQTLLADWSESRAEQTQAVEAAMQQAEEAIARGRDENDPRWIHTPEYDRLVKTGMTPYENLFGSDLGPGGWKAINTAHYSLIEDAIETHGRQNNARFLIIFGAWHKYWFLEKLHGRDGLKVRSLQEFLYQ